MARQHVAVFQTQFEVVERKGYKIYVESMEAFLFMTRQVAVVVGDLERETTSAAQSAALAVRECEGSARLFSEEEQASRSSRAVHIGQRSSTEGKMSI